MKSQGNPVNPTAENFVPVRLDIEFDGQRFRDVFTWNLLLTEFQSYEGQDMYTGGKIVLVKDLNNFESDPEEFARSFCKDVGIDDPEVGIAVQNVFSARESRISTKGRRGFEHSLPSKAGGTALDLMKLFGFRSTVTRKKKE